MAVQFSELPFFKTNKYDEKIKADNLCTINVCRCNGSDRKG